MKDGDGQLDVAKMTGTFLLALTAGRTHHAAVDGAQLGVVQALLARPLALLVQSLWVLDMANTYALDLLGREESELDLLHRLERRQRFREGRHVDGLVGVHDSGVLVSTLLRALDRGSALLDRGPLKQMRFVGRSLPRHWPVLFSATSPLSTSRDLSEGRLRALRPLASRTFRYYDAVVSSAIPADGAMRGAPVRMGGLERLSVTRPEVNRRPAGD